MEGMGPKLTPVVVKRLLGHLSVLILWPAPL